MNKVAVLTGDIIHSKKLNQQQRKKLEQVLWETLEKSVEQGKYFEILRGDSFQLLLNQPQLALRKCIELRCLIKMGMSDIVEEKTDARISIGIGEISFMGKTLGSSDGTAFHRSGFGLDELKKMKKRITILTGNEQKDELLEIISVLVDIIVSEWSAAQSEAIYWSSQGLTQQKIADKLSIVQSAVNKRLQSAHWNEIEEVLLYFEKTKD